MQNNEWITLWTKPRSTLRRILETNPRKHVLLLSILNGILASITWLLILWISHPSDKRLSELFLIPLFILIGIIFGLINLYLGSFLYKIIGSWLKGQGNYTEVKCAVGWSNYPYIISGLFGLISEALVHHPLLQFPFSLLKLIFFIWGFVIFLKLIAEAHRFSAWKSLFLFIITFAIILAFVVSMSLIFGYLFRNSLVKNTQSIKVFD